MFREKISEFSELMKKITLNLRSQSYQKKTNNSEIFKIIFREKNLRVIDKKL